MVEILTIEGTDGAKSPLRRILPKLLNGPQTIAASVTAIPVVTDFRKNDLTGSYMTNNLRMQNRGSKRSLTRIFGTVTHLNNSVNGRVVNLSATGMALDLASPLLAARGSRVRVESDDLGVIEGIVKWNRMNRLGIQLHNSSNTLAKVSSYFRFFHREVKPVLHR